MKTISVVGAAIIDPPYVLAFRRGPTVAMAGKWEFPGGKLERGESPRDALARDLEEELRLSLPIGESLGIGTAKLNPETRVELEVFEAHGTYQAVRYTLSDHDQALWLHVDKLHSLEWAAADIPILDELERRLRA